MARNLTVPTVIKELSRVALDVQVDIFTSEIPVRDLVRDLAVNHAFAEIPEIAGQIDITEAIEAESGNA